MPAFRLNQQGIRNMTAAEAVRTQYHIKARPVDKRENYIKRCVAVPNDKLRNQRWRAFYQ
jgi:signal peptidase I